MKVQVMKLNYDGNWLIEYDDQRKVNPYSIYHKYYSSGWHKELKERYADLQSCMYYVLQETTGHERRMA